MNKWLCCIVLVIVFSSCIRRNQGTTGPSTEVMHISTYASEIPSSDSISAALIVLSLNDMDSSLTKNWESYTQRKDVHNTLVIVTISDSYTKSQYVSSFYSFLSTGLSGKEAFLLTEEKFVTRKQDLKTHFFE